MKLKWNQVWLGAVGTALLFTAGKELVGLNLGRESTVSAYGAAGSVVLVVLWVYYASVILFLGAEFTKAFTKASGPKPETEDEATYSPTPNSGLSQLCRAHYSSPSTSVWQTRCARAVRLLLPRGWYR